MKDELERITEVMAEVLQRYRNETPPGNSPSMICHEADDILALYAAWNRRATPEPDSDLVEIAYEAARPHFHYAKKGTPDAHSFDRTQPAILLRKALPAIIAAIEPQIAAKAREDERALPDAIVALRRVEALEAENARLREALHRIEDASYINQLQGTANFERLQSIARAKLGEGTLDG